GRDVGVDRYRHVGQVLGQPPPAGRLLVALLHGGLAPAPDDAAGHLRAGGHRVDDPAGRVDADRAPQPEQAEVGVDADLGEDHAPGPDRVGRALAVLVELAAPGQREGPLADELVDPGAIERLEGVAAALAELGELLGYVAGGSRDRAAGAHGRRGAVGGPGR